MGSSILVAPVLDAGASKVKLYLPQLPKNHKWINAYTLLPAAVNTYPSWITIDAPMGKLGVFVAEDAVTDINLKDFLALMKTFA